MSDDRINFKFDLESVDIDLSDIITNDIQKDIFSKMAIRLSKYLNISSEKLNEVIAYAATKSQKDMNVPFKTFNEAMPQERFKIADDMKKEIISFLSLYLEKPEDLMKLETIAEKMFVQYLRDFGSR